MAADGSFSVRIHGRCRRSGAAGSHCGYLDDFFKLTVRGIPRRCQVLLTDRTECPARLDGKWASNGEIRPAITGSRECGLRVR
jgi:hypothetical protein